MSAFKPDSMPADLEKQFSARRAQMKKLGYVEEMSLADEVNAWKKVIAANNEQRKKLHKYKSEILDCLTPFVSMSAEAAWLKIEGLARAYDRREAAPFRAGNLGAQHIIAQRRSPKLYSRIRAFSGKMKDELVNCDPEDLWLHWHLKNIIDALDKAAADQEFPPHKGTSSPVPVALIGDCIVDLALLYKQCTNKKPGAGAGPFARLVAAFWNALDNDRGDVAIIKDIQKARKAHPEAF